jgi:cysteinyl-tRNA synthetase
MSLRLYDTLTRQVREFEPLRPGVASLYLCGATVQAPPHVGHIRSGLAFDVVRRWLSHRGYDVVFCRNVTDIEDKILHRSAVEGRPWWEIAEANQRAFTQAYDVLGCLPPTVEPRATGHVPEMVTLIRRLVAAGHAYASGGDVYFDVRSWPSYGRLSGQQPAKMLATEPAAGTPKRDPLDFALWKGAKPGEPTWDTPWGSGRPGWHVECSAMATKYLGAEFDIHGGGLDLVFPHHENEIAQACAAGDGFARYWMHNYWVTTSGEKMSKSLGNSLLVSEVVRRVRPVALRYYLVAAHYRSHIEYSEAALGEAAAAYERLEGFVTRASDLVGPVDPEATPMCADFAVAMDDDFGVPAALAALHEVVHEGNKGLADLDRPTVRATLASVRRMLGVLGLDPLDPQWRSRSGAEDGLRSTVDRLVAVALEQRQAARERREYDTADAIRRALGDAGVVVEDTPAGPRWTLARQS